MRHCQKTITTAKIFWTQITQIFADIKRKISVHLRPMILAAAGGRAMGGRRNYSSSYE
jgi:hypothetical protein